MSLIITFYCCFLHLFPLNIVLQFIYFILSLLTTALFCELC